MNIRFRNLILAVGAALLLGGCSTTRFTVGHSPSKIENPETFETFAIMPIPGHENDPITILVVGEGETILHGLKSILEDRGYRHASFEESDFLVRLLGFRYDPEEKAKEEAQPLEKMMQNYPGHRTHSVDDGMRVIENTDRWFLVVEVFDKDSGKLVWNGWSKALSSSSFEKDEDRFSALEQILEQFPN